MQKLQIQSPLWQIKWSKLNNKLTPARVTSRESYLESGYLVRVARLLVYMCPPTSMCTGAFALVSWAGKGIPWAARGETGDRVRDSRDMLLPSWKQVYRKAMGIKVEEKNYNTTPQWSYTRKLIVSPLNGIRSLPCLSGRIFSLEIIATALIKYVCIFSCGTGGEDRRMLIRKPGWRER